MDVKNGPTDGPLPGMGPDLSRLPPQEQDYLRDVFAGEALPPFHSDIIAKRVYSPDLHPHRLNFLLRGVSGDESIEVASSASNELPHQSSQSKAMILDITTWLRDGRLADLEVQKAAQEFIFTRGDLYASDMLILQYTVDKGQPKGELTYENVREAILVVLMVESPSPFKEFDAASDRHVHRFTRMVADTGLSYEMKAKTIYVQCDKCLAELRDGTNAESADGTPDRLQVWLASF